MPKTAPQFAKLRFGPSGLHYFNRHSGLNVLLDECVVPKRLWHEAPRQVSIALTNTCDLACEYCYAPKTFGVINVDRLCDWIREFDQNGTLGIGFGGGEPTLHPRFTQLCRFVTDETRMAVSFTTHGHHLHRRVLANLEGKINFVRLSMDGVGSTYERLRARSFTNFTMRLRDVRRIASYGINFVVNSETISELDRAITFAHDEGACEFLLLPERPVKSRAGLGRAEQESLRKWVEDYRGGVRLAISEAGAELIGAHDPCKLETGIRAFVHISADERLHATSFSAIGVPITSAGVMAAVQNLKALSISV